MKGHASVICIGELIIDFFCKDVGIGLEKGKIFEKQAGGAPANVCAAIVKLGGTAIFSGKVGNDPFGLFLKNTLDELNVDTSMLILDDAHPTTLAFVSLQEDGERDFVFNRGADAHLKEEELDQEKIDRAGILHFGSATALLEGQFQSTYLNLVRSAHEAGTFISFDPNYREDLWKGRESVFIELSKKIICLSDFVKVSEEELKMISANDNLVEGTNFFHRLGAKMVAVTLGEKGTFISNGRNQETVPTIEVTSIDSTGAGDAFVGAMLYQFAQLDSRALLNEFDKLKEITSFSNKVGALVCTKIGAITALPTIEEVN